MSDTNSSSGPAVAATEQPLPAQSAAPITNKTPAKRTRAPKTKKPTEEWIKVTKKNKKKPSPIATPKTTPPQPAAKKENTQKQYRKKTPNSPPAAESSPKVETSKIKPRRNGANNVLTPEEEEIKKRYVDEEEQLKKKRVLADEIFFDLVHQPAAQENNEGEKKSTWSKVLFPRSGNEQTRQLLTRVAGVHVEFPFPGRRTTEETIVVLGVVVVSVPELSVLHSDVREVKLTQPQIHGYPSFREVNHILEMIKSIPTELTPQLFVVDGHGVLHSRGFGLASHLGVIGDVPTIGVSRKFVAVDGLSESETRGLCKEQISKRLEALEIVSPLSGHSLAAVMKTGKGSESVYISVGHKVSLGTAIEIVRVVCPGVFPLPVEEAITKTKEKSSAIAALSPKLQAGFGRTARRQGGKQNRRGEGKTEQTTPVANGGVAKSRTKGAGGRQGAKQKGNRGEGKNNAVKEGQNPKQQGKPAFQRSTGKNGSQNQQAQNAGGRPNQRRSQGGKKTGAQKTNVWQRIQPATVPASSDQQPQEPTQQPAQQQQPKQDVKQPAPQGGASRQRERGKQQTTKQVLQPKKPAQAPEASTPVSEKKD